MQKLKPIRVLLAAFLCLPAFAQAQTITLDEFLAQLKQKYPLFEKERLAIQVEEEERTGLLGAEDWYIFSSVNLSHEEPAIAFSGPERTNAFLMSGGAERVFWKTGGRLSASFSSGFARIKIDPLFGVPNSFYQNQIAVVYAHPLLKNKRGFLDRLEYDLKQFDVDFSEVQAIENQENFLAEVAGKFLDWVFYSEQKRIVAERIALAEGELARAQRKREANLIDQVDVIRAADAVRIARQNQVLVESQWKGLQAELAVLSGNQELYASNPAFNLYDFLEIGAFEEAADHLKKNSRLIQTLNVRLNQLEFARKGFEETLKPDLSLVARLNTKRLDEGLGKSWLMNKPDLIVGVHLSVPLENRTANSQIAKADLQAAQLAKQSEELALTLTSALANLHIQIQEFEKALKLNIEQIASAQEKTQEELKLYNQGRGDLTFVIQSQDNEETAKLTYAGNALTYHKLILEYRALMDQLHE